MYYQYLFIVVSLIFIGSCSNQKQKAQEEQEISENVQQEMHSEIKKDFQDKVVSNPVDSIQLIVSTGGMRVDEYGIPHTQIVMGHKNDTTENHFQKIEIDSTYNYTPILKKNYQALSIPANAHFAYRSYYAGHGFRVYGVVDQSKEELKIYEQEYGEMEEATPFHLKHHYDVSHHDFYSLIQ